MIAQVKHLGICDRCQKPTAKRRVEHPYWQGTQLVVIIKGVPAWVCVFCGFHYFEPQVEMALELIVQDYGRMGSLFPTPTTEYREMAAF